MYAEIIDFSWTETYETSCLPFESNSKTFRLYEESFVCSSAWIPNSNFSSSSGFLDKRRYHIGCSRTKSLSLGRDCIYSYISFSHWRLIFPKAKWIPGPEAAPPPDGLDG